MDAELSTLDLSDVPSLIHDGRLQRHLTQMALANRAGLSRGTVVRAERGQSTTLDTVKRLLHAIDEAPAPTMDEASSTATSALHSPGASVAIPRNLWSIAHSEHLSVTAVDSVLGASLKPLELRTEEDWLDLIHAIQRWPRLFTIGS